MQCNICGSNLVRGFTYCLECGNPVPPELLEESGLPKRNNIDRGPQEAQGAPSAAKPANDLQSDEPVGDLQPQLMGGDQDRGEALKPQLMGGDTFNQGKALKPKLMGIGEDEAGEALKPQFIGGEEHTGGGAKVRASFQNSSSNVDDGASEKLVFCPNCGMHMQHDPSKCEICGMALGNMPNNVPTTKSGIPLFNTDPDPFSGTGGLGGLGGIGGFGGISDEDVARIENFTNGNTDPMFNSGSSAFNVQATPADFARLTEQIASFSSPAGMTNIGVTESTIIRQREPEKGQEREISDFSMIDDLQSEPIPIVDTHVPVVGDYSMEENPDEDINIDPFAFVSMSMDEDEPKAAPKLEEQTTNAPEPIREEVSEPISEPVTAEQPVEIVPVIDDSRFDPVQPPSFFGSAAEDADFGDIAPFIAEEAPVITESAPSVKVSTERSAQNAATPPTAVAISAPPAKPQAEQAVSGFTRQPSEDVLPQQARPYQQPQQAQPYQQPQQAQPYQQSQQAQPYQQPQQAQPYQQPPQTQPYQQAQPSGTASETAEKTKKCYACGRKMPSGDKFCPNCGRSMFGMPNPNLIHPAPAPRPAKSKTPVVVLVVIIVLIAIAAVIFFVTKGNAAEINFDGLSQVVSNTEQTLFNAPAEHFIS